MSDPKSLSDMRQSYERDQLLEALAGANPFALFDRWFAEAVAAGVPEPNAMALATSVQDRPSLRIVLLKGFDEQGFVFFTNYQSRKGRELQANPQAALTFFWQQAERQIRIEGQVERLDAAASEAYFRSRDPDSRIGAWASPQSQLIADRAELEQRVAEVEARYQGQEEIPKPDFWGGFRLKPDYIEFWQGRKSRLHDRLCYSLTEKGHWVRARLAP